jgi:hypothetical protein
MMYLSADDVPNSWPWSQVILVLGIGLLGFMLFVAIVASLIEVRKTKIVAKQEDDLRQLVTRYERLAETTLDAQQRVAADMSELRSRASSIEQILRTVE